MNDFNKLRDQIVAEIAHQFQIPTHMLIATFATTFVDEKRLRRYNNSIRASMKQSRRHMRRIRAHISKMSRKRKIHHVYRRY